MVLAYMPLLWCSFSCRGVRFVTYGGGGRSSSLVGDVQTFWMSRRPLRLRGRACLRRLQCAMPDCCSKQVPLPYTSHSSLPAFCARQPGRRKPFLMACAPRNSGLTLLVHGSSSSSSSSGAAHTHLGLGLVTMDGLQVCCCMECMDLSQPCPGICSMCLTWLWRRHGEQTGG